MTKVTVIIPVKNGEGTIEKCLQKIKLQTIASELEIIVLDSMSTDTTRQIALSYGAKIIEIPKGAFNHGLTRNRGVNSATGSLIYFTVQDAHLSETDQLEKMVSHFNDEELEAVVGMQATPQDKDTNPARWFQRFTKPETVFRHYPDGSFGKMSLQKQFEHCAWDNVNAMYRKSALEKIPFIKTDFAEDWLWVKDALAAKMKLAFDPSLIVYHYHHRDFNYSFRIQYILNYNFYNQFNIYPTILPFVKPVLTDLYLVWKNREIYLKDKIFWSFHNFSGRVGVLLSHITFITAGKLFGKDALDHTFRLFCKSIPQGKTKIGN